MTSPGPVPEIADRPTPTVRDALAAVKTFIDRFIHFESVDQLHAVTLWAVSTWVFDAYDVTPYLHIKSPLMRAGKTNLIELLELVCRKAMIVANMTPAALYRLVDLRQPTLLLDEIDAVFTKGRSTDPAKEEYRGLLNAGFRKKGRVFRSNQKGDILEFSPFCPKALAGIGDLPGTIADRSITIPLERKPASVKKERQRMRLVNPIGEEISALVAAAMEGMTEVIAGMTPDLPNELNDREQDTWELLFAVADLAGGDWPAYARAAALKLSADTQDATETIGELLLTDIRDVWLDDEAAIPTSVLLERLIALEEAPWGNWYGREIDARFIANKLKPFGVHSTQVKVAGKKHKGYRWERLAPVWDRYLKPATLNIGGTEGTGGTSLATYEESVGYPEGTRGVPHGSDTEGTPEVPQRYPTGNPYTPTKVPPVPQVPPKERGSAVDAVSDWRGLVESVEYRDGEIVVKLRGRPPATFNTDDLDGPAFALGDTIAITPNGDAGRWSVEIIERTVPL